MDSRWSDYVQTSDELYRSRALRLNDSNKNIWLSAMKIEDGMNILEIGCGGGIFCHRIKGYFPNTIVTGLDFDIGHIEYANAKTRELGLDCRFINDDCKNMSFADNSFDLCYSYTVMEHVETNIFFNEQYRILKPKGTIVIMGVWPGLNVNSGDISSDMVEENALFKKACNVQSDFESSMNVCKYPLKVNEIPPILEKSRFTNIDINTFSIMSYAPDFAGISRDMAIESINVNRLFNVNSVQKIAKICPSALNVCEIKRLEFLINRRYDTRIEKYLSGEKLWDVSTSTVIVFTARK